MERHNWECDGMEPEADGCYVLHSDALAHAEERAARVTQERDELRARVAELESRLHEHARLFTAGDDDLTAKLKARAEKAEAALRKHGGHDNDCALAIDLRNRVEAGWEGDCTCGWSEVERESGGD